MSIKELKTRYKLPMHSFWKNVQRICIVFAGIVPTTTELSEYYGWFPEGTIPQSVKTIIGGVIVIGIIIPKFTVANDEQLKKELDK